jgi:hypothetical protein
MRNLSEQILLIITNLEDGVDERDWEIVSSCIEDLERVHDELDRQENGFGYEDE